MKIKVKATQIEDGEVEFISLVKHGANRSPFKIVKAETNQSLWAGLLPELDKLEKWYADTQSTESKETTLVNTDERGADKLTELEIAKLRQRLNSLNNQQLNLWEQPKNPLFAKLDADLTFAIEKAELELAALTTERQQDQMDCSSAFFRRGGTSVHSQAMVSDSAYDQRDASLRKAESQIDLSPIVTQTDAEEVRKVDLGGMKL